jgi:hypothetical protein
MLDYWGMKFKLGLALEISCSRQVACHELIIFFTDTLLSSVVVETKGRLGFLIIETLF